jgi:hypothetical protein
MNRIGYPRPPNPCKSGAPSGRDARRRKWMQRRSARLPLPGRTLSPCSAGGLLLLPMTHNDWEIPRFSAAAVTLLGDLHRHGWSMRIVPLFRRSCLDWKAFADAANELHERRWVRVTWRRRPRADPAGGLPDGCREVDRITATRHARRRYRATWPDVW